MTIYRCMPLHQLQLCRGVRPSHEYPQYDIKPPDCKAPALEIWGMWSTPSLPLLPGQHWPWVVASDRVLSMGQIEQTMCANKWLMLIVTVI